ncbi:M90 family metallopeptidase [Aquimarina pacifica]|uniref:M90 family metallopeptidase n=1 Tax=Aquimarina pacifica TaxID=1296415 RepID=UPI00046E6686|nr:M90 family metallopeptidase [Aquimarina pacifica]
MIYILIFLGLLAFLGYVIKTTQPKPVADFPKHWHAILDNHVLYYKKLSPDEQLRFQKKMMHFLNEVIIEGVHLTIVETDTILIAASAVIPIFGFDQWQYTNLSTVLLYPDYFDEDLQFTGVPSENRRIAGMVGSGRFDKQMILSKKALYHGFENKTDKNNTAIHEFVHLMDKSDGVIDGIPKNLLQHTYAIPWLELMHTKMIEIDTDSSDIRAYGGTNKAEFFAVASEYFFERPDLLKRKHPELYALLAKCFQQEI